MSEGLAQVARTEFLVGASGLVCGSEHFGLDRWEYVDIRLDVQPYYQEKTIEETQRYRVFIDQEGATQKIITDDENLRGLRSYIDHPAKTKEQWAQFKKRFNPTTPSRYPPFWPEKVEALNACVAAKLK